MSLINLLTDPKDFIFYAGKGYPGDGSKTGMTDIPYGNDQPGGGSSNQPYIKTDIPDQSSPLNGGADSDFLLRGGITAPLDAAQDVLRLSKFFIDTKSPNGLFFTLKQNLLSRTSVRTQASTGPSYGGATGGVNQGIYTPLSTLAQAGVGFTGTHLNLLGLDPSSPMLGVVDGGLFPNLGLNRYSDVVKFSQNAKNNRLVGLYQVKTLQDPTFIPEGLKGSYAVSDDIILSYGGGPNSILGIGKTNILFADQRTGLNNPNINPPQKTIFTLENYDGSPKIIGDFTGFTTPARIKINYRTVLGLLGASGYYSAYSDKGIINNDITSDGDLLRVDNVYEPDSLTPNLEKIGSLTWTPSFQDPIGPNSSTTYLQDLAETGSLSTLIFDTNVQSGGVQDLNSVYNSGSLVSNDKILENNTKVLTQTQILSINNNKSNNINIGSPSIIDFRKRLLNNEDFAAPDYSGPNSKNIENRVFLGDPGIKGYVGSYETGKDGLDGNPLGPLDKINASKLNKDKTKIIYDSNGAEKEGKSNDLVKFRIASIDSGGGSEKIYMHFRAFLDSFQDSYNASWADHQYLGRGEKFYTYNGFARAISLSWTVVAQSKEELIPMYRKLNYLASNLAPDYSTNGYMRGPLVSLTLGGYLYEQPGFITSLTYDIPNDSTWEIGINNEGGDDENVKELSHMIKVTGFNFTPIQTFTPRKGNPNSLGSIPFIALTAGGASNY
jgi:hypothetical protein